VDLSSFHLSSFSPFYVWPSCLGHFFASRLNFLASTRFLGTLDSRDIPDCSGCKLEKFSALPFNKSISSLTPFDLVHYDVCRSSPVFTKGVSRYYFSFIDDSTSLTWIYLMKRQSYYLTIFKNFNDLVKTQHSATIKIFRCDLGVNTLLMILPLYLFLMELYVIPLAQTLLNKMVLLKENIVILLKLQDHSCYLSMFQVPFGRSYSYSNSCCELSQTFKHKTILNKRKRKT